MSTRALSVAVALAAAALLTPAFTASAKDDPAAQAAARQKLRDEYKAAKKYPTADLSYFVDSTKLKDSRWIIKDVSPPADPDQGLMFLAEFPSGNATDASASIKFVVVKCIQSNNVKKVDYSHEFKSWGKSVKMSEVEKLATGYYEDWIREATEVIKDKCKPTDGKKIGPAKYWGCAVGTDKEEKRRVRMDWYVWAASGAGGSYTWTITVTTAEKFIDNPDWLDKIEDMVKNIKEMTDKRAK